MCQCVYQNISKYSCIRHENNTFYRWGVPELTLLSEWLGFAHKVEIDDVCLI